MKKVLFSLVLFLSVSFAFGQFELNMDFETWQSDFAIYGLGEAPKGWVLVTGNPDVQKITDAQSGNYAMHIESNIVTNQEMDFQDTLVGGIAVIGNEEDFSAFYNKRPESQLLY